MKVHYLEWTDKFGDQSVIYETWPKETSTVSVMNDQSSYVGKDYPTMTETIGGTTRQVPGSILRGYMDYLSASYD